MNNHNSFSDLAFPITLEQFNTLQLVIKDFSENQLLWLSGYLWGLVNNQKITNKVNISKNKKEPVITLISSSQTGNARRASEWLRDELNSIQLNVNLIHASDYTYKKINKEKILLIITSTQGEGEPPEESAALYNFLMSKKAPKMKETVFAVFGLGDTSYEFFSKAGKDIDNRLAELGAKRLIDRVDADVEYKNKLKVWCSLLTKHLKTHIKNNLFEQVETNIIKESNKNFNINYNRKNPFNASCLVNQKITGRKSDKDIRHIEIDISNSQIIYNPGDAIGIWYKNDDSLINEILKLVKLKGDEKVKIHDKFIPITCALKNQFDLTRNNNKTIEKYALLSKNKNLLSMINDRCKMQKYANLYPIVDMIRLSPTRLTAEKLISILRPLTPRLYSISSAQSENENEVHITVGIISFNIENYCRGGGASTWLSNLREEENISIFIENNNNFRLPVDKKLPIIMIGTGTGIAPFRSFMQQRDYDSSSGKNWLFFGNRHFTEDFLYQIEWQDYVKRGLLNKINLAWSRDQSEKVYIQDKIRANGVDIWCWIEEGAHIYICGDANKMAKDVEAALLEVISKQGQMNKEKAEDFLNELRIEYRYQRDIY
ncbi:sulfite reductase subunit alpha [Candidatus Pantoea edessiphila]|uniref:Sulfite reductase [NADPH] flavoprotein alpha-component n=1 Tax=Candidatus Pantoea edessiphila TaxID=2044610 RepID=A0A2P5T1P9_9GAMM|nr:NADPH-dependent assimilatory sulfite reductase flavoprotein subunit [Candidatus Pantoea edessiphila]PPI88483.1 sulfite reductase subunit alpha [Candidatus Pantoea edessiphila]